jgi:dGTP triphosphohydrolase
MWHHSKVNASRKLGQKVIEELFNMLVMNPKNLIRFSLSSKKELLPSIEREGIERLVSDKISSLTDRNAINIHSKYFNSNYSL